MYLIQQVIPFFCTLFYYNYNERNELPPAACKTVPEIPTLQKRFKKLCLIMSMPLFKSTITKWHIFTPDFARRVV